MTVATPELHPADQVHADRLVRVGRRYGVMYLDSFPALAPECDHGRPINECRICLELRHAEQTSVAVRAAYAFGDWPRATARP